MKLQFKLQATHGSSDVEVEVDRLVVAGWAGRDRAAIDHHIEELAAIGVPRPSTVPLFYRVSNILAVQDAHIQVVGEETSGEVEALLVAGPDGMYVSVASDHTDRKLETTGVALSKQICPKPVASFAWPYPEVADHWDSLVIRSFIIEEGREVLYQEGPLSSLRAPQDLFEGFTGNEEPLPAGTAMICGTVGAIGGIRPSSTFTFELHDPVLNRSIRHTYNIDVLPEIA